MGACAFVPLTLLDDHSIYPNFSNLRQDAVFTKLLEQEVEFYDKAGPGEITSYLSQDISGLKGKECTEGGIWHIGMQIKMHTPARAPKTHEAHFLTQYHTNSSLLTFSLDILYGNLQRDRGLRAILEAIVGTILLFKLQPRLGLLFSLVIPSVATITVCSRKRDGSRGYTEVRSNKA